MEIKPGALSGDRLRESANSPEVHAMAIQTALKLLEAEKEWTKMDLSVAKRCSTVALYAAHLMRNYLHMVGEEQIDAIEAKHHKD